MVLVIEQSGNDKEKEKSLLALLVLLNHWVLPSPQDLQGAKKKLPLKDLWKKRYMYMYMYTSDAIIQTGENFFYQFLYLLSLANFSVFSLTHPSELAKIDTKIFSYQII